jgi:hypothetical protein
MGCGISRLAPSLATRYFSFLTNIPFSSDKKNAPPLVSGIPADYDKVENLQRKKTTKKGSGCSPCHDSINDLL